MGDLQGPFVAPDLAGDRAVAEIPAENYWFQRNVAAYAWAAERIRGLEILHVAGGDGDGTAILAGQAADVVGVGVDERHIHHAGTTDPSARFSHGDVLELPFPAASFDAIVALQVIEHVPGPRDFVGECARLLRPEGTLLMSTQNRLTSSPEHVRRPVHTYTFAPDELRSVVASHLTVETLVGIFHAGRLRLVERLLRKPFAERLVEQPAPDWPRWLHRAVIKTTPDDFVIRGGTLEASLDLLVVARR